MATRQDSDGVYTTDGKIMRAVMGYNKAFRPNAVTWAQHKHEGGGEFWLSCQLLRATGTTWRIRHDNGDENEVPPRTVRMRIG
jgi:hypothetical protein